MTSIRAEQIGSLLRPPALLARRAADAEQPAIAQQQDEAIAACLERQRTTGIQIYTDGEFRRTGFITGFVDAVDGFADGQLASLPWRGGVGTEPDSPNSRIVARTLVPRRTIAGEEARFLLEHAPGPFKITLPSPLLFATAAWQRGISEAAYPTRSELLFHVAQILASEAAQLARAGVPYLQLDSPSYTSWVDEDVRAFYRSKGIDLEALFDEAIEADNLILDAAAATGATTGLHLCRGNSMGRWRAQGGYDEIAERLYQELRCHRLLLEYDTPRAGTFESLRFVPNDKMVVLGLISTKTGQIERREDVLRRVDDASRYITLDRLALSPQCGFASSGAGNPLSEDDQWRKLELVASLAAEIWGAT